VLRALPSPIFAPNFADSNVNWGTVWGTTREQFDSNFFIAPSASRVTQNLLNDFAGDPETVKIRSQSAPKRVPAVPRNLLRFDCGPNHLCHQSIEVQRIPERIAKNKSSGGIPGTISMPVEEEFQLRDHRNGSFALLPFWLADLIPPAR